MQVALAVQYGLIKDTDNNVVAAINDIRNNVSRGTFDQGKFPYTVTIALRDISQFIRRLNFPIMNQLFEI